MEIFGSTGIFWKYLEIKVEVEVCVHYNRSRITPRVQPTRTHKYKNLFRGDSLFQKSISFMRIYDVI